MRVITIDDGISYHCDDKGGECGYVYELSKAFADYLDLKLETVVAATAEELVKKLEHGEGHMIAYGLHMSEINRSRVLFADNITSSPVVLVQKRSKDRISDVTGLIGRSVCVCRDSRSAARLENLDQELDGDIDILTVPDSVSASELIAGVARGEYGLCLADKDDVACVAGIFQNLDYDLEVGLNATKAWAFSKNAPELADEFDNWFKSENVKLLSDKLRGKYFAANPCVKKHGFAVLSDSISPYDCIFRREAVRIGWDWRLLASVAWNESRFNPYAESHMGAAGLMQLMPKTAARYGCVDYDIYDPEKSVAAGVLYIRRLNDIFSVVESPEERIKFILAGYNAGPGHIFDAMGIAEKYGADPYRWNDNVETYLLMLADEKYYNDSLCQHGFFRGKHTVRYVADVYEKYEEFCNAKYLLRIN